MRRKGSMEVGELRIIGGELRHRKIEYPIDPRTRPMKDRTRGALFNIAGQMLDGRIAIDLFSGSGILAIESISRGATLAFAVEQHIETANRIRVLAAKFGISDKLRVLTRDAFEVFNNDTAFVQSIIGAPWLVTICPPYELWHSRKSELSNMIREWCSAAPIGSTIICELDESSHSKRSALTDSPLPSNFSWKFYVHKPAILAACRVRD